MAGHRYGRPDIVAGGPALDGVEEKKLNHAFMIVFGTPAGAAVLRELARITRDRVLRPPHLDGSLSYIEGARALLDVIEQRIQLGKEGKPDVQV